MSGHEHVSLPLWKSTIEGNEFGKPIEVQMGSKQVVLILEFPIGENGQTTKALYRSEKTLQFPIDRRIPIPQELYRDAAYHQMDELLGWEVSAPVIPWRLSDDDKGVLRPYWTTVQNMQIYNFAKEKLISDPFWQKVAVLDYICAVIDRTYNDVLIVPSGTVPNGKVVIDSGLSFVPGTDFVNQQSLVRSVLNGVEIDSTLLFQLEQVNSEQLQHALAQYIDQEGIDWTKKRIEKILEAGVIV